MKITLVIVDDHDILREGIRARLQDHDKFEILAEGRNGHEAIDLYQRHKPDILLTDISMPEMNGLDAAIQILTDDSAAKVIFLSVYDDPEYVTKAVNIGAKGFILKDVSKPEMVNAICRVAQCGKYFGPGVSTIVNETKPEQDYNLTGRERDVLSRIAKGAANKEIALDLNLSVRTIESHRSSIREKTGGGNAVTLAKIAAELNL
jgi:two-component system nitrate/nitrite response regulator NarL